MSQVNKRSRNSRNGGENLEPLPTDLMIEIFSKLPAKSAARFRSLSKLWVSMLSLPYFTELFLTRSLTRPRIVFAVQRDNEWLFYSSPQPQNPYDNSSLVAIDLHTKFSRDVSWYPERCSYASGLICLSDMWISKEAVPILCNPITGQYANLPRVKMLKETGIWFLGFDPVGKQFKVLYMNKIIFIGRDQYVLTLGTGKLRWRKIQCPLIPNKYHNICDKGICINGVVYYIAREVIESSFVIVCFDVRSEKFKLIEANFIVKEYNLLINYKGKLGVICWKWASKILEYSIWILVDVEKQEWSIHVYTLPRNKICSCCSFTVVGMTARGEIVLAQGYTSKPFHVTYLNPERNTLQRVEIQGFGETYSRVYTFVDYVENLNIIDAKQFKYSKDLCSIREEEEMDRDK